MKIKPGSGEVSNPYLKTRTEPPRSNSEKSFSDVLQASQQRNPVVPQTVNPAPLVYTVKRGDSINKIAKQFNIKDPKQIAKDNNIANPDFISPGQKILINQSQTRSAQSKGIHPKAAHLMEAQLLTAQPAAPELKSSQAKTEKAKTGVEMTASWYGKEYHNRPTASGQRYDMNKNTLAHNTLPLGTKVRLVNPENGKVADGVITDRGPFVKGRDVDVSYALAKQLGFVSKGVTKLNVEVLDTPSNT